MITAEPSRFKEQTTMRATAGVSILLALLVTGAAVSRGHAQEPSILPALLNEVKGLRAAMEHMAADGPRVQLALGRLQLQEQRLNTLVVRLDSVRQQLALSQRMVTNHQSQSGHLEAALRNNPGPEQREDVERMMAMMKQEAAMAAADVQRLTAEEASLASDLASEQARWSDFNQRLEELERSMGKR